MRRIKLSNSELVVKVDSDLYDDLSKYTWRLDKYGYAATVRRINGKCKTIFMHRLVNKTPSGFDTDHINRDRLDNRSGNLRTATRSQNNANSKINHRNTSGTKGVSLHKQTGKWRAYIFVNSKQYSLGLHNKIETAIKRRKIAEKELYGDFV